MSVNASWSGTNNLQQSSGLLISNRLISAWCYGVSVTTNGGTAFTSGESNISIDHSRALQPSIGAGTTRYTVRDTEPGAAGSGNTIASDVWFHLAGYDPSNTDRYCWYNGTASHTIAGAARNPNAPVYSRIGAELAGAQSSSAWRYAEESIWDVAAFTPAQVDALVQRLRTLVSTNVIDPRTINEDIGEPWTGKLLHYWSLVDNTAEGLNDKVSTAHWSVNGTVNTNGGHPTVDVWLETTRFLPVASPLYYGAALLANKTGISFKITGGHSNLTGTLLGSGTNGTTDNDGNFVLPESVTLESDGVPPTANDPVMLHLYWEEGSDPVVDRSLIVKTTLVAA